MSILFPYSIKAARRIIDESSLSSSTPIEGEGVVVSAVQYKLKPMKSLDEYINDIEAHYCLAAERNSKLIVFPELFGITPLCCAPFIKRLFRNKKAAAAQIKPDGSEVGLWNLRIRESDGLCPALTRALLNSLSPINDIVSLMLSRFSEKYSTLTASGSSLEIIDGKLYNVQTLYGSDGRVVGRQKKINPMESELRLGVCYADEIEVFDSDIGKIAIPVCMDASYSENFRIFYEKGAKIVAMGTFNLEEYNQYLALRGLRLRCSEYPLYGVKSAMTGFAAGNIATGEAEIDAPCGCAVGGVLAKSSAAFGDELVSARIYPERDFIIDDSRADFNSPVLRSLLEQLYS